MRRVVSYRNAERFVKHGLLLKKSSFIDVRSPFPIRCEQSWSLIIHYKQLQHGDAMLVRSWLLASCLAPDTSLAIFQVSGSCANYKDALQNSLIRLLRARAIRWKMAGVRLLAPRNYACIMLLKTTTLRHPLHSTHPGPRAAPFLAVSKQLLFLVIRRVILTLLTKLEPFCWLE